VIVEDCGGELRRNSAAVLEVDFYSDENIAEWDKAEALSDQERQQIPERLKPHDACVSGWECALHCCP
jgi:antitoxin PrlF